MKKLTTLFLLLCLIFVYISHNDVQADREIASLNVQTNYSDAFDSVVKLYVEKRPNEWYGCSAVVYKITEDEVLLMSAYHCFEKDDGTTLKGGIVRFYTGSKEEWQAATLKWYKFDPPNIDLAVLSVPKASFKKMPSFLYMGDKRPTKGTRVANIGCPGNAKDPFKFTIEGKILGYSLQGVVAKVISDKTEHIPGRSGSPVFDRGFTRILGILAWGSNNKQTFTFIPCDLIKKIKWDRVDA